MTRTNIIDFPGNPHPVSRRAVSATIITLPVFSIIRFPANRMSPSRLARRLRNLQKLLAE